MLQWEMTASPTRNAAPSCAKRPLLSKYVHVCRNRLGEHSLLQRQHPLLCHDCKKAEPAGQRGHH